MTTFTPPSYADAPDTNWSTADLCDAALADPSLELRILPPAYRSFGGRSWYFGEVVTVKAPQLDGAMSLAPLLTQPGKNRVLLVDAQGSTTQAALGDRMAGLAVQNGWSGIVIHGFVRDSAILARMPLGVHALGTVPNRATTMPTAEASEHVTLHGHRVKTGEWLYADEDGIIVLSRRHTDA